MPRSSWDIVLERTTPIHVHPCPECYHHFRCDQECTIEPDMELLDGTPCGSHDVCPSCTHDTLGEVVESDTPVQGVSDNQLSFDAIWARTS